MRTTEKKDDLTEALETIVPNTFGGYVGKPTWPEHPEDTATPEPVRQEEEHTPLHWMIHEPLDCQGKCGYPHNRTVIVHSEYGIQIADCGTRSRVARDNAAFIVRSVNNHKRLIDAMIKAIRLLDDHVDNALEAVVILRAALAEGKED